MDVAELSPEVIEAAEKQAEADRELLAQLQARTAELQQEPIDIVTDHPVDEDGLPDRQRVFMNRAQRRAQVRFYAQFLAETEKQRPAPVPYAIPRSQRRRKKGGRRA